MLVKAAIVGEGEAVTPENAQKEIGRTAHAVLRGELSYIEGARKIFSLSHVANLDHDSDVVRFVAIDSNTDALPLGEVRRYWQPQTLEKLQPEIQRLEQWARDYGRTACENLAARFGGSENSSQATTGT